MSTDENTHKFVRIRSHLKPPLRTVRVHLLCTPAIAHNDLMASFDKLPSDRWRVQVRRNGQHASRTFRLKSEAEAWSWDHRQGRRRHARERFGCRHLAQNVDGGLISRSRVHMACTCTMEGTGKVERSPWNSSCVIFRLPPELNMPSHIRWRSAAPIRNQSSARATFRAKNGRRLRRAVSGGRHDD